MSEKIADTEITAYVKYIQRAREKSEHPQQLNNAKAELIGFLLEHVEPSSAYYVRYRIVESPLDAEYKFDPEDRQITLYGDLRLLTTTFIKRLRKLVK